MTSEYLFLPLRSLRDLAGETERKIAELEERQRQLLEREIVADLELRFADCDALLAESDRISDELGPLIARLDEIEEEIAWAERGEERSLSPIVL